MESTRRRYDNLDWGEVQKMLSDLARDHFSDSYRNPLLTFYTDMNKAISSTQQASQALLEYDEMGGQNADYIRIDNLGKFVLICSVKGTIMRNILNHCTAKSIRRNKSAILTYLTEELEWIRPSLAIDIYDDLYYGAFVNNNCYDKETKKIKVDEIAKYLNPKEYRNWRERPDDVFVDYEYDTNNNRCLKLQIGNTANIPKLNEYIKQNYYFLQKAKNPNNKLREQIVLKTAISWLCTVTEYNDKTIARIIMSVFAGDKAVKSFLPTCIKQDDEPFAAKIRGIRHELKKEMETDWFNMAKKELESDRDSNQALYRTHYESNPLGTFFERFNLIFDNRNKKFHLLPIE